MPVYPCMRRACIFSLYFCVRAKSVERPQWETFEKVQGVTFCLQNVQNKEYMDQLQTQVEDLKERHALQHVANDK